MKTIGIIGGMGPLATVDLFKRIVDKTKAECDQDHIHILIDCNTDIPDRTKSIISQGQSPLKEMIKTAKTLENAGADFLIIACNTAHYYYKDLSSTITIPILNMLEETTKFIKNKYGKDVVVGLLATDGTISTGIYNRYFEKKGIKVIYPKETQGKVMDYIYQGVKKGNYEGCKEGFLDAVQELRDLGADLVLLGCTELSAANDVFNFKGNFVDPMDIIAIRAIEFAGGTVRK